MLSLKRVLLDERAPPESIESVADLRQPLSHDRDHPRIYLVGGCAANATGVQSTCRTLAAATKAAIGRLSAAHKFTFAVDIMFVDERELWVTWLSLPIVTRHIDTLNVTLRVANGHKNREWVDESTGRVYQVVSELQHDVTGAPLFVWTFSHLLLSFLTRGPPLDLAERKLLHSPPDKHIAVIRMDISIKALDHARLAPESARREWLRARPRFHQTVENRADLQELHKLVMRPEWMAEILAGRHGVDALLWLDDSAPGLAVYGHIGESISFFVDGRPFKRFDISTFFSNLFLPGSNSSYYISGFWEHPREERPVIFRAWWNETLLLRTRLGFPVGAAANRLAFPSLGSVTVQRPQRKTVSGWSLLCCARSTSL